MLLGAQNGLQHLRQLQREELIALFSFLKVVLNHRAQLPGNLIRNQIVFTDSDHLLQAVLDFLPPDFIIKLDFNLQLNRLAVIYFHDLLPLAG